MPKTYKNILIIKMSSLGDIIHALPSLYALRKAYPEARITWAVHPAFAGILPGKPWIDEVYLVDRKRIKQLSYWRKIRKDLHAHHFDLVIDLQMIAKSGLISFLSGGKKKIGYHDGREGSFLFSKPISGSHKHGHIIEQLLDVMRYLGCPADKIEFPLPNLTKEMETVTALLKKHGVKGRYVLLVPGTRGDYKKWPIEYWGELARKLAEDKITTVIAGSKGEMPMGEAIRKISPSPYTVNLMGQTNLLELAALEKMAALHISSDTGPLHIANAVHVPIIALFGPTPHKRNGPYGNSNCHFLIADHPLTKECRMSSIPVDRVYQLVHEILKKDD